MLRMLINLIASNVAIKFGLKGPLSSPTLACATGLNAIGDSYIKIKNNDVNNVINLTGRCNCLRWIRSKYTPFGFPRNE